MESPTSVDKGKILANDFYRFDELFLSEEDRMVRDTVREFMAKEVFPFIYEWDRGKTHPYANPEELVRSLTKKIGGTLSVFGAAIEGIETYLSHLDFVPLTHTSYGIVAREMEYADTALRSLFSVQSSLCMFAIYEYGSEEQKKKWLPLLYTGEKLACFGLTEPQGGSNPGDMRTTAKKVSGGWVLNGNKAWITNGFADVAVVWAMTEEGIRGFLVERGTPGFSFRNEEKWALRAGVVSSLSFGNCEIKDDGFLPGTQNEKKGQVKYALRCLNEARYSIAWGVVGAARACLEEVLHYSKERHLFGAALSSKQETQRKLAWMLNECENAQLVAAQLGRLKEKKALSHVHVSLAKYNNVSKALEITQLACELLPADVFCFDAYHSGRHMRNMHVVKKYEGTHEIHQFIVGKEITGSSAL